MSSSEQWMHELPEAFLTWLDGRRVDDVECVVADLAGTSRGKAMPARKFARADAMYLPTSIFYQTITGEYVDLEDMPDQWTESDLVLVPDYTAATAVPWSADVTLQVVHDVLNHDGSPNMMTPRNVLKRVVEQYSKNGWKPVVAPEIEFYLTKPNIDPNLPVEPPIGRTGRQGIARQAYSMSAVEEYGPVIDDIYDFAEAQGFEIDTIIQEGGAGQIEINLQHGEPLKLADQVFFFKRLIREAAIRNHCFATFMAKPMEEQPGSAMHIHQSVVDMKNGHNVFNNADGEPSELFYGFIAGQQQSLPNVLCMLAPYVNSYRRFRRDDSAPINLEWGFDNRTTGIRIPLSNVQSRRVENRVVGMDSNPYLAIAASLACGLLGMRQLSTPRNNLTTDAYSLPHNLPRDLSRALELFNDIPELEELLGREFCTLFRAVKSQESDAFLQVISPWEREHLLLNV